MNRKQKINCPKCDEILVCKSSRKLKTGIRSALYACKCGEKYLIHGNEINRQTVDSVHYNKLRRKAAVRHTVKNRKATHMLPGGRFIAGRCDSGSE